MPQSLPRSANQLPATRWLFLALCLLFSSCTAAQTAVIRSAEPNPFVGAEGFAFEDVAYIDLQVDGRTEQEYLSELDAEEQVDWSEDKQRIQSVIEESAAEEGEGVLHFFDSAPFRIRPIIRKIESGYYRIPAWSAVTKVFVTFEITDAEGQVADVIQCNDSVAFEVFANPTVSGRLESAARAIGDLLAEYLESRVYP